MKSNAFLGLRTAIYFVSDMDEAKAWYRTLLRVDPYYDSPDYVGFNVAGFELGLHPVSDGKKPGPGVETYWGVANMDEAWARVTAIGARVVDPPNDVGEGILVAAVADPFGNVIGLIQNPNFPNEA
jgi:predicted enzyme related to lactoylglutathione lyase